MSSLDKIQEQFQNYILGNSEEIMNAIQETPRLSAQDRLEIYCNAYSTRLLEALESDFLGVKNLLGEKQFQQLGQDYLQSYPSTYRSLRWIANHFISFLTQTAPYRDNLILIEMARFEWTLLTLFDAADSAIVSIEEISALPPNLWQNMRLTLQPALQRIDLYWNVVPIWEAVVQQGIVSPQPQKAANPVSWLLWRSSNWDVLFVSLSVEEAWALDAVSAGNTFGFICEGLCEWIDEKQVAQHAASLLRAWIEQGMVATVGVL